MPFFSRQVADLTSEDIFELLEAKARENIRLEFKRAMPDRLELLKKLSGFANTYGGHLLIGAAEEGKRGELDSLPGIDPQPSFDQQVSSWCFEGVYPPLVPDISAPIPHPQDPAKVFYVIYVEESLATPHFLEERGGCWVRTGEYSQKPKEGLATYDELQHLTSRRSRAIDLRAFLLDRATERFATHADNYFNETERVVGDTTFTFALLPSFPSTSFLAHETLRKAMQASRLQGRGIYMPSGDPRGQAGGFYYPSPRNGIFAYLECDVHRMLYYAQEVRSESAPSDPMLYLNNVLALIIFYLEYGNRLYQQVGYEGLLHLSFELRGIGNRDVFVFDNARHGSGLRLRSQLDDTLVITRSIRARVLRTDQFGLILDIVREVCLGLGLSGAFAPNAHFAEETVTAAVDYLLWRDNALLPPGYPELY
jgi:hypothetical protein